MAAKFCKETYGKRKNLDASSKLNKYVPFAGPGFHYVRQYGLIFIKILLKCLLYKFRFELPTKSQVLSPSISHVSYKI